jgi:beta-lactamase regulating signal transducer with metallopeptidase domain
MSVLQAIAELSAARLMNSVVEGLLVAILAWALLRILRRQNSGTRFAIWFSALIVIAALPLVGLTSRAPVSGRPEIAIAPSWAVYIFGAWAFIAAIALTRVAVGLWKVRNLRRSCTAVEGQFTTNETKAFKTSTNEDVRLTTEGRREARFERQVQVSVSDRVTVPTAIGFFRPMVILPRWTVEELSAEELNAVVLHEMAHLRRWDDWSNLAQKVIRALFFFHPAVWWLDSRLTLEREMACDDLVLAETSDARGYAECLVSMAEKNLFRRGLAMAQAAVGRLRHMSLRVARILEHQPGATRVWKPAIGLLAVFSAAGVMTVARTSPVIGFTESSATTIADNSVHVPAPMVVPASLRSSTDRRAANRPETRVNQANAKPTRKAMTQEQMLARASSVTPKMVAAKTSAVQGTRMAPGKAPAEPTQSFVVVETTYYQGTQGAFWTMTVWRVQAASAHEKQAVTAALPKST